MAALAVLQAHIDLRRFPESMSTNRATRWGADLPLLVSFSGIDGAGKSTQIANLENHLSQAGLRFQRFAFWDDVAVLKRFREDSMVKLFKGEKGIGSPEKPVRRNDKNVTRWYLTVGRCCLFFMDALQLRSMIGRLRSMDLDVIIFDRYAFDELASLRLEHPLVRAFARFLLWWVPRPEIAYVLDADPEAAHRRKPEYPVDFLRRYRRAYLFLSTLIGMTVIEPGGAQHVEERVWEAFHKRWENTAPNGLAPNRVGTEEAHGI
jgi:thymidylate kinase